MALASARLIEVYLIMAKAVYSSENVQQFDHLRALINLSFVPSHAHRHMEIPPDFHAWEVPAHGVSGYPPKWKHTKFLCSYLGEELKSCHCWYVW